jgi:hypothetical protein
MEGQATSVPAGETAEPRRAGQGSLKPSLLASLAVTQNLSHGQVVIVIAKWVLVCAGLLLVLWSPAEIGQLRVQILVLLLLAVQNFYHHAQLLKRRAVPDLVAYVASAADLIVVTVLVLIQGGFDSNLYIFYFPALVALSVVFQPKVTAFFTASLMGIYATISLGTIAGSGASDQDAHVLISRLAMMAAVATCGALSYRLEERRRLTGSAGGVRQPSLQERFHRVVS